MDADDDADSLAAFLLGGHTCYCRWHADDRSQDCVLIDASGHWAFATEAACLGSWPSWRPDLTGPLAPANYDAVRAWLAGRRLATPAGDLVDTWNLAGDVARGVGLPWRDRGRLPDRVFDKLTAAAVPWAFGMEAYSQRWSARELVVAKRVALQAVQVLLRAMSSTWSGAGVAHEVAGLTLAVWQTAGDGRTSSSTSDAATSTTASGWVSD